MKSVNNNFETPQQDSKYGKMKSIRSGGNNGSALDNKGGSIDVFQDGEEGEKNNVSSKKKEKRRNIMETLAQPQAVALNIDTKLTGKVFYCLGPENGFRQFIARLVTHKYFDPFIMILIFVSTILMAVDSPLNDPDSTLSQVLNIIDIVITSFFVIESITKIIAYGFIMNGPESYLRISWNIMDFIIVVFSVSFTCFEEP
jgi:Ion transport protein